MRIDKYWLNLKKTIPGRPKEGDFNVSDPIPKGYGLAYCEYDRAVEVYYPIPINLLVRYGKNCYWRFIRLCWEIGFIDTTIGERFSWRDFYRIKTH